MRLSDKAIQEFKSIYREEFGEDISDAEAEEAAERVLRFFEIILQPLPNPPHSRPCR